MRCDPTFLQAFEQVYNEQFDERMLAIDSREPHTFSRKHEKKMTKLIKRQGKPYFRFICTAGRRAACLVIAIVIFAAAALSVKAVRERVFKFITSIFSDHSVIETESSADGKYPETIQDEYCLITLPEGYTRAHKDKTDTFLTIVYTKGDQRIVFEQYTKSAFKLSVDNQHTEYSEYRDPDGQTYNVYASGDFTMVICDNGRYVFTVESNLDKNSAIELCKSTKLEN